MSKKIWSRESKLWSVICDQNSNSSSLLIFSALNLHLRIIASNSYKMNSFESFIHSLNKNSNTTLFKLTKKKKTVASRRKSINTKTKHLNSYWKFNAMKQGGKSKHYRIRIKWFKRTTRDLKKKRTDALSEIGALEKTVRS